LEAFTTLFESMLDWGFLKTTMIKLETTIALLQINQSSMPRIQHSNFLFQIFRKTLHIKVYFSIFKKSM